MDDEARLAAVRRPGGRGKRTERWAAAVAEGTARRDALLENLAAQIAAGGVGVALGSAKGFVGASVPPVIAEGDAGSVRFRLSPHLHLSEDDQLQRTKTGERQWEISC